MLTQSEKIHMDIKDIAKSIKQQLKKEYPSCEFSIMIKRYSMGQSLSISLMKAPFEVFNKSFTQDKNGNIYDERSYAHAQLNQYTLTENDGYCNGVYLTKEAQKTLQRAVELSGYFNYDNSEPQTDYYDVNFYLHLNIGKWNKPFIKS